MKTPIVLAALFAAVGLAGCGKSEPPASTSSAPASTSATTATAPAPATTGTAPNAPAAPTASAGGPGAPGDVTGAGASFPAPLYAKWAADYNKATGAKINYQSVGSGAGIKQIDSKTVDFGASDMPLKDEELAQKGLVQFPTVIGGVVPVVNIKGVAPGQLRLNGQVLGDIYLGKIAKWSDPAIKALNPSVALPDAAIAPVRRADGSGTSFIFTNYLSKVNPEWKARVGEGTAVNWPTGTGGKGNEGVAAFVGRLPNSIGYVEYAYVKQNKMTYALMQNAGGQFVAPEDKAFQAAAAGADWSKSFYQILTNQPSAQAWPITGATFILMHKAQDKPGQAAATLKFFDWAFKNGDKTADDLDYVPMPPPVKTQVEKLWATQIKDGSGNLVAYK
jgi:phosphate transport system substrate-binding protein